MNNDEKDLDSTLDRHLGLFNAPSADQFDISEERILGRFQSRTASSLDDVMMASRSVKFFGKPWRWGLPAAAVVLFAALVSVVVFQSRAAATVQVADGFLYRVPGGERQALHVGDEIRIGEVLHSNGGGAVIALADGSRVEMRSKSELTLETANDGIRIRLDSGSVIVTAAEQRSGHLYVQTKDVTVSVVGTVFLVNAEEEGSRVAVIQGEVRVQHGETLNKLFPGDQVATGPSMEALPVSREISWSRNASTHLVLLEQNTQREAVRLEFEVASIRLQPGAPTLTCQGIDGRLREPTYTAVRSSLSAPMGQCVGRAHLGALIAYAYGIPTWNVSGVPDLGGEGQTFFIQAKADEPSKTTADQLRQMLQSLLASRFKLQFHPETKESQMYVLSVLRKGHKLIETLGVEESPILRASADLTEFTIEGKSPLKSLADLLSPMAGSPVLDRTDLLGTYGYALNLRVAQPTGEISAAGPGAPRGASRTFDPPIARAVEEQLGLQLELQKVPVETIVVDHVERPSEN